MNMRWRLTIVVLAGIALAVVSTQTVDRQWLAGDSHIHSQWSPGYDETKSPPEPIVAGDARYPTPTKNMSRTIRYVGGHFRGTIF